MQPQLFLFDDGKDTDDRNLPVDTSDLLPAQTEAADSATASVWVENRKDLPAEEEETGVNENPFAEIQKKQQDKIETLLLTTGRKRGRKSFKEMDEEAILPEVPDDDVLFQKQYYPTRTVADWFGISTTQLRAWESEFDILKPKKNGKGDRFFRPEDVKNLKLIYHLIRRRKFTVQGAKQYLAENKKKLQTVAQLTETLTAFRQFLLELKAISE